MQKTLTRVIEAGGDPYHNYHNLLLAVESLPPLRPSVSWLKLRRLGNSPRLFRLLAAARRSPTAFFFPFCCERRRALGFMELALQVHEAVPQLLLPVLPHLCSQLEAEDDGKRLSAVNVVGHLFSKSESDLVGEYPELFCVFLRRFVDQKVMTEPAIRPPSVSCLTKFPAMPRWRSALRRSAFRSRFLHAASPRTPKRRYHHHPPPPSLWLQRS